MKIEINDENKAKFFAVHLGNELIVPEIPENDTYPFFYNEKGLILCGILNNSIIVNRIAEQKRDMFGQTVLLLKSILLITDKDAEFLSKLENNNMYVRWTKEQILNRGRNISKWLFKELENDYCNDIFSTKNFINAVDYLRLEGYALPWMGLSIEEIVEANWVKII